MVSERQKRLAKKQKQREYRAAKKFEEERKTAEAYSSDNQTDIQYAPGIKKIRLNTSSVSPVLVDVLIDNSINTRLDDKIPEFTRSCLSSPE